MEERKTVILKRDCPASLIPVGTRVTLHAGEEATLVQSLGGSHTVIVNGNMFRVEEPDADALGIEAQVKPAASVASAPVSPEELEKQVWAQLRTCYDPEIPVNIVDLGLVYDCKVTPIAGAENSYRVDVKMTLTAPGCGMGPMLQQDVQNKLMSLEPVDEANAELVWEPQWNQGMLSEAAKLELGLM